MSKLMMPNFQAEEVLNLAKSFSDSENGARTREFEVLSPEDALGYFNRTTILADYTNDALNKVLRDAGFVLTEVKMAGGNRSEDMEFPVLNSNPNRGLFLSNLLGVTDAARLFNALRIWNKVCTELTPANWAEQKANYETMKRENRDGIKEGDHLPKVIAELRKINQTLNLVARTEQRVIGQVKCTLQVSGTPNSSWLIAEAVENRFDIAFREAKKNLNLSGSDLADFFLRKPNAAPTTVAVPSLETVKTATPAPSNDLLAQARAENARLMEELARKDSDTGTGNLEPDNDLTQEELDAMDETGIRAYLGSIGVKPKKLEGKTVEELREFAASYID